MPFNYDKLRGKITEKFGTVERFASSLGITATSAGKKLSNKSGWKQEEIVESCNLLGILPEEIPTYFFTA